MKLSKLAMLAAIVCASYTGNANAGQNEIQLTSYCAAGCDCGEPACGCETTECCDAPVADCCDAPVADCCDSGCAPGCDSGCAPGCDSGCDAAGCGAAGGCADCDLGDPFALFDTSGAWSAGGWVQMGYHSNAIPLFNSRPDNFQLHQGWLYAEKALDTSNGFDIGGRIDYVYGTDAPDTQAFGADRGWDNNWDNGADYGHAIPQAYFEAGYGDASVKIGNFYTLIGYEVVTAPDNFFYSHAYTMYNSEPFTHTGVLGTFNASDDLTVWGGYTFGWDSGFNDNGDNFLGGFSAAVNDSLTFTYATTIGRFGEARFGGVEKGYMHSIVSDFALSDNLQYIAQSDYLSTEDNTGATVRDTFGINQYLIYSVNDCLSYGGRFEYYNEEGVFSAVGNDADIYALTLGVNYRPHANVILRPEVRFDWDDDQVAGLDQGADQTTFGVDSIFTF